MSKVKLNQIVALNAPKKGEFQKQITKSYQILQKPEPFYGREGTYTPRDEENGEKLPAESTKVQLRVDSILEELKEPWSEMFDVVLTNDVGNSQATADLIVDETTILKNVPVSTLLFLEKKLVEWGNVLSAIPVLPLSHTWNYNSDFALYETPVQHTIRTTKEEIPLVLYEATDKHPAQTKTIVKDVPVGSWERKITSSAMPLTEVDRLKKKLAKLKEGVIKAREQANSMEIEQQKGGDQILNFLFS